MTLRQPLDYSIDVRSPVNSVLQGYERGLAIRQSAQQQAAARQRQKDVLTLAQMENPSVQDYVTVMAKYPDMTDQLKQSWEMLSEEKRGNKTQQLLEMDSILEAGNIELARQRLEERREAAVNSGDEEEVAGTSAMLKTLDVSPQAAKFATTSSLIATMGADKYADFKSKVGRSGKQFTLLSKQDKKQLGLDPAKQYQMNLADNKITAVGGGGVTVNVGDEGKLGTVPPGYVVKQDEKGEYYMKPVKGGPAEKAMKEAEKKKGESGELEKRAGTVVVEDIERLKDKIEDASFYSPVLGVTGAMFSLIPGTNRVDAEQLKESIVSNIGFDRLQQMRDASPTGGALGQVSDRELNTLQSVLGSISLSQSEDQLVENLDRLEKIYTGILNKIQKNFDKPVDNINDALDKIEKEEFNTSPRVEELESKLGRKLTSEEIQYLQDRGL